MTSFETFGLKEAYKRVQKSGDRLSEFETLIEWDAFRPILDDLYNNKTSQGGRPNIDPIVMLKLLVLQSLYNLSDPELERQVADRISFRKFIGFSTKVPDFSTVWLFRERLIASGKDKQIWELYQSQLEIKGLHIEKGVLQDATFITADPGNRSSKNSEGREPKTRRNRDGTFTKKGSKSYFGYKLHSLLDKKHHLIRRIETTTASVHDSRVDLSKKGETVYRDKGYFGVEPNGRNKTMRRAVRGSVLSLKDIRRNLVISKIRAPIERSYAVIKRIFNGGHVLVTTVKRAHIKNLFWTFSYNLIQLGTLKRRGAW